MGLLPLHVCIPHACFAPKLDTTWSLQDAGLGRPCSRCSCTTCSTLAARRERGLGTAASTARCRIRWQIPRRSTGTDIKTKIAKLQRVRLSAYVRLCQIHGRRKLFLTRYSVVPLQGFCKIVRVETQAETMGPSRCDHVQSAFADQDYHHQEKILQILWKLTELTCFYRRWLFLLFYKQMKLM